MSRLGRWAVNLGNPRRSGRILNRVGLSLQLPAGVDILELGAGRGGLSALLFERYRPGRLVVTDVDPDQLAAARRFLTHRWTVIPPTIEIRTADARALPFEDRSFDAVFAINILHHVERRHSEYLERPRALAKIRRVLRPGGFLVYAEFIRTEDVRRTLRELGFQLVADRRGFRRHELAVYRLPT
jgi:arsenite methyltransferase